MVLEHPYKPVGYPPASWAIGLARVLGPGAGDSHPRRLVADFVMSCHVATVSVVALQEDELYVYLDPRLAVSTRNIFQVPQPHFAL